MAELEQVEMSTYRAELARDLLILVKKYCRIMAWEVPELDEERARPLVVQALHTALKDVDRDS